jgi:hypothetical protein
LGFDGAPTCDVIFHTSTLRVRGNDMRLHEMARER